MSGDRTVASGIGEAATEGPSSDAVAPTISSGARSSMGRASTEPDDQAAFAEVRASHFRIAEEIARGGMGRIRIARDRRLGRWVALKELLANDEGLVLRFEREARITARLQHPSIVSVYEAGLLDSQQPFYAMPLVKGRSFDAVIVEKKTLAERLALVPNVLAVADAMAYAHGERVIHRDLKPGNVLIGSFGETVVIDWGLAKELEDADDRPSHESLGDRETETIAGAVIGTPAYMPPEQAAGATVDERADVYAIGAMLAHVLTGAMPYRGSSSAEILAAVRVGPPRPVRELEPDAPADLVAIVERAMARDKGDRYPTARELADDLRRFTTGQLVGAHRYSLRQLLRRWVRRHFAAVAVAATAMVVLVVGGGLAVHRIMEERTRADELRKLAEASRGDADDMTRFMLGEMHDKLQAIGRLDVLDTVARKAEGYYAKSDKGAELTAHAFVNIGDVLVSRNDFAGARAALASALQLQLGLRMWNPAGDVALAKTYRALAHLSLKQRDLPRAKAELDGALAALATHTDAEALHARAMALGDLAQVTKDTGDLASAGKQLGGAIAIDESLVAAHPAWDVELAEDHRQLAMIVHSQGNVAGAIEHARTAAAIMDRAAKRDPGGMDMMDRLALAHAWLGNELQFGGDPADALEEFRTALTTYQALFARDPSNAEVEGMLASAHKAVGSALAQRDDIPAALVEMREAARLSDELVEREPSNGAHLDTSLGTHELLGRLLSEADQPKPAVEELRKALAMADHARERGPTDKKAQRNAARVHNELAEALTKGGDPASALTELHASLALSEALLAADPTNTWARSDMSSSHRGLGNALQALHRDDEAITELRAALAISQDQAGKDTKNIELAQRIVGLHESIGDIVAAHHKKDAKIEYQAALDLARTLAAASPGRQTLQQSVDRLTKKLRKS